MNINNSGMDYSALFSSLGGNNNTTSGNGNMLSDYASIKNGSYAKVVKAYYKKNPAKSVNDNKNSNAADQDSPEVKTDKQVSGYAGTLKSAVDDLTSSKSLFEKKTMKDADGNEKTDYDWDSITKKVSNFIDAYNNTVKKAGESETKGVLSVGSNMITGTALQVNHLSWVGVSINKDHTLSLDKDKLKSASMSDIKTMFSGTGSFAYGVGASASMIEKRADVASGVKSTYSNDASYNRFNNVSSMLDTFS